MYVCMYVCMYVYIYLYIYIYIYINTKKTYTCEYVYIKKICVHLNIHVYLLIYMYTYEGTCISIIIHFSKIKKCKNINLYCVNIHVYLKKKKYIYIYMPTPPFAKGRAAPGTTAGVELVFPTCQPSNARLRPQHSVFKGHSRVPFARLQNSTKPCEPFAAAPTSHSGHSILSLRGFKPALCQASKPPKRLTAPLGPQLAV